MFIEPSSVSHVIAVVILWVGNSFLVIWFLSPVHHPKYLGFKRFIVAYYSGLSILCGSYDTYKKILITVLVSFSDFSLNPHKKISLSHNCFSTVIKYWSWISTLYTLRKCSWLQSYLLKWLTTLGLLCFCVCRQGKKKVISNGKSLWAFWRCTSRLISRLVRP